jgi:formylglycine-generating enzyme required for sulfatase activity
VRRRGVTLGVPAWLAVGCSLARPLDGVSDREPAPPPDPECNWNGVLDADETDVDCGGGVCSPCRVSQACGVWTDCTTGDCSGGVCACPQRMTPIETSPGSNHYYCMDEYEVTIWEYEMFLDYYPKQQQHDRCSHKTGYQPAAWPQRLGDYDLRPVTDVDWCDAFTFCAEHGKHLCGRAWSWGYTGFEQFGESDSNGEWFNACSVTATLKYPYAADSYDPLACNGVEAMYGGTLSATAMPGCSLYGILPPYHLSGNVAEWEDACQRSDSDDPAEDPCRFRGGSYQSDAAGLTCSAYEWQSRSFSSPLVGFRCCSG